MRKRLLLVLLLIALSAFFLLPVSSSAGRADTAGFPSRPRLIVILVIDQLRYDYLVRFRPYFVERGFNLLLGGANFINCRYDYVVTTTAPGHATLFTGAYPNTHGIVGNGWYDRSLHRTVSSVEDPTTRLVVGSEDSGKPLSESPGFSPRKLIGSTLGDELRLASNFQSKVVAISLKERAAILPGGHAANAAYWYDAKSGHFVTSSYYMQALPPWVARFNKQSPAKAYCAKAWRALSETPGAEGKTFMEFKLAANEPCPNPRFLDWLKETPFMNEIELSFAREAIQNEHLGQGPATDLLAVSLSVNDYVGHTFGPYSGEVADATLRTDRDFAAFFGDLDRMVGLNNVWIALSADHGVAPSPHLIKAHSLGLGNASTGAIQKAVEEALSSAFGQDRWIEGVREFSIYLNRAALKARGVDPARGEARAAEAAEAVPGVAAAFTRTQLLTGSMVQSPLVRRVLNSFNPQRSGDILFILEPYAVPVRGETETTHGSPWSYDSQVPFVLWGSAFKPGIYTGPCQPIDLAPTLAAALGLTQPSGAEGQPLSQALK